MSGIRQNCPTCGKEHFSEFTSLCDDCNPFSPKKKEKDESRWEDNGGPTAPPDVPKQNDKPKVRRLSIAHARIVQKQAYSCAYCGLKYWGKSGTGTPISSWNGDRVLGIFCSACNYLLNVKWRKRVRASNRRKRELRSNGSGTEGDSQ